MASNLRSYMLRCHRTPSLFLLLLLFTVDRARGRCIEAATCAPTFVFCSISISACCHRRHRQTIDVAA